MFTRIHGAIKMIKYLTVGVNPPPLDKKIIVKKAPKDFIFDDMANIRTMSSDIWSQESAAEYLIGNGLTLWAEV